MALTESPKCLSACLLVSLLALDPPWDPLECCRNSFRAILNVLLNNVPHTHMHIASPWAPVGANNEGLTPG